MLRRVARSIDPIILLALIGLAMPGPAWAGCLSGSGYGFILVKTVITEWIYVANDDCTPDHNYAIYDFSLTLVDFTAGRTATIAPGSGDSGVHTANPMTVLPPQDMDGVPGWEGPYTFHAQSLRDIGTYDYLFEGLYTDGYDVWPMQSDVLGFYVDNDPPTANPSAGGNHHVGDTVSLVANASDPDGGSLTYQWSIQSRPSGSPGSITNSTSSTATLALNHKNNIGSWTIELKVADNEAEQKTFTVGFEVLNRPPDISISGATDIDALTDIALTGNPELDADGETLSWVWDLLSSPATSSHVPQNAFSTQRTLTIPTGPADIGEWQFRLTGTDEHDASDTANVTVNVNAIPPEIDLIGATEIDVFESIDLETTIVTDAYGDPLVSFEWELLQVPVSAGIPLGPIGNASSLFIPTTAADAGTWRFRLTVTDQVGETAEEDISVLVDAEPVAEIIGPDQTGNLTLDLTLDGSSSVDPDTPGTPPDYGHLSDGPVSVSPGIVRWSWSVLEVPPEHYGAFFPGPVADVFGVNGSGPTLYLAAHDLRAGDWLFQLEIEDGEGNVAWADHWVTVIEEGLPPIALVSPPSYHLLTPDGFTMGPIGISGAASFDLDNLLDEPYAPGVGIEHYAWSWQSFPLTCPFPPALPSGPSSSQALLYPGGAPVDGLCQGIYQPVLTVTDDDTPTVRSSSAVGLVLIGNCEGVLCIDHPTTAAPEYVKFSDQTDILIHYHLNSVLYDLPSYFAGLRLQLKINHLLSPGTVTHDKAWDVDLLPSDKGGPLVMHWSGFDNFGQRPQSGIYDVTLQLVDAFGNPTADFTEQPASIHIQTLEIAVNPGADTLLNLNGVDELTDALHVPYDVTGTLPGETGYDQLTYRIFEAGTSALIVEDHVYTPFSGTLTWDGEIGSGLLVDPGAYEIELEIFENGASLGISDRHLFNAYRIDADLAGIAEEDEFDPGAHIRIGDTIDMTVGVEGDFPPLSGTVRIEFETESGTLSATEGTTSVAIDPSPDLPATSFTLPRTYTLEGQARGAAEKTILRVSFTPDGSGTSQKIAEDRVAVTVADARLRIAASDPDRQHTDGVFLRGAAAPIAVTHFNFAELRPHMQPIRLEVGPEVPGATVELTLIEGSSLNLELFDDSGIFVPVPVPNTWTDTDFVAGALELDLLAYGREFGDARLKLEYQLGTTVLASEELLLRVRHLPGMVGHAVLPPVFPFFLPLATGNAGEPVTIALDPTRHTELEGRNAAIYVVAHKTPVEWAADPSLVDVSGGPETITFPAGSISANVHTVWAASVAGKYDVVVDFGNSPEDPADFVTDAQLDPGDLLDQRADGLPSLSIHGPTGAAGPSGTVTIDYGMVAPITTTLVPDGFDGLSEPGGFDFRLRGRVVRPDPMPASAPIVMIAHGNHTPRTVEPIGGGGTVTVDADLTSDENFRGHTWLQTQLASHGFVTISVDLDEMHGSTAFVSPTITSTGIQLRGWVILKNLELALTDPAFVGGALNGHIDTGRVYLIGHSRGGEAVLQALEQIASAAHQPPGGALDAAVTGSTVRGIVSMAPTTQSLEAGALAAQNVPFLLLYGTADGDVNGAFPQVMPFRHYDRSLQDRYAIAIEGANHNFWNDSWTPSDAEHGLVFAGAPGDFTDLNLVPLVPPVGAGLITRAQQKAVAAAYIGAFLTMIEDNDPSARAYLVEPASRLRPLGVDPALILHGQSRGAPAAPAVVLDDYETQASTTTASSGETVTPTAIGGADEDLLQDRLPAVVNQPEDRFFQETRGVVFNWSAAASYSQEVPAAGRDLRGATAISLRVAQQPGHANTLALAGPVSFGLELEDGSGNTREMASTVLVTVPGIYNSVVGGNDTTSGIFTTLRFPVHAFETDGTTIDLGDIRHVRLKFATGGFSAQGRLAVDDLEIER